MKIGVRNDAGMAGRPQKPIQKPREGRPVYFIGEWIRALGFQQNEVAEAVGINEGYLSGLINRRKDNPSAAMLIKIANFLRIPSDYLRRPPPSPEFIQEAAGLDSGVLARLKPRH